jgi:hypothetical protein
MLKYRILIQSYVLRCVLMCCVYGDTIHVEMALLCLLVVLS